MQKSDRNQENDNNRAGSSIAARVCPQCGNAKIKRSSRKTSDGLLKALFYKSYRCRECRHRFWEMNPSRLVALLAVLILVSGLFLGALWVVSNQQPPVAVAAKITQTVSHDPIKNLAEKGEAEAELQMGLRYASTTTWGIKDEKTAARWFEKAARHDQVEAQYHYGLALLEGKGVIQDYKMAFYWLEKAARQGNAQAQFAFGEMYHAGLGIKVDIERAYLWFNLAAAQGVGKAAFVRDLVTQLLTPNQISAMQEEAIRISRDSRYKQK